MKRIRLLMAILLATFSWQTSFAQLENGTVYWIQDVATGQFISQGANWGTQATVQEVGGLGLQAVYVSDGVYKLKNIMWNKVNNADLGLRTSDRYLDQAAGEVTLETADGGYKLNTSSGYLCNNGDINGDGVKRLGSTNEAAAATVWRFLTKSQYDAAIQAYKDANAATYATNLGYSANTVAELEAILATDYMAKDYTTSINNPTLSSNWDNWTHGAAAGSNRNEGAGVGSGCAEFWNGCGAASQTISGLANGLYKVEFVGTFRPKDNTNSEKCPSEYTSSPAFVYANDAKIEFLHWIDVPAKANGRSGVTKANGYGQSFYTYVSDGTLKIGVVQGCWENGNMWCPFGQFTLTYYTDQVADDDITALIATIPTEGTVPAAVTTNLNTLKTNLESTKTIADYNALASAITAANGMVTNYARYHSVKSAAKTIAENANTTAADAAVEEATTNEAINAAIATLRGAFLTELPNVTIPNDPGYIDVTAVMVDNPSVSTNTNYWTAVENGSAKTGGSWAVCNYGECEFYNQNFKFYQTLALTPGTWEFGVTGFHRAGNHSTYFYAGEDKILIPGVGSDVVNNMAGAKTYFDNGNGKVALKFLIEEEQDVEIGINNQDTETDKWTIFRDFTLKYYGAPDYSVYQNQWNTLTTDAATAKDTYPNVNGAELTALNTAIANAPNEDSKKDDYVSKINALSTALNTFNLAGTSGNYEALEAEKIKAAALGMTNEAITEAASTTKTGLQALQDLMVAEYNFVSTNYAYAVNLGTWNKSDNAGTMTSQHWDGTSTSTYLEQGTGDLAYNLNSWTVTYDQTLDLPAGNYVFKVAGRTAEDHVTLNLNVTNVNDAENPVLLGTVNDFPKGDTGLGINKAGATSFDANDQAGFANNGNGRGWQWRYVQFTLSEPASVKVAVVAVADAQYRWMSFCNATVQTNNQDNVALMEALVALNEAKAAPTLTQHTNVGNAAFQYDEETENTLWNAYNTAKSNADNFSLTAETTLSNVTTLVNDLTTAQNAYNNFTELNAPAEGQRFNIVLTYDGYDYNNKAITFKPNAEAQGGYDIQYAAEANANYAQAFTFTKVEGNNYKLSQIDQDGNVRYVTDQLTGGYGDSNERIRTTTDAEKAAAFQIIATATEGVYNIKNIVANNYIGSQDAGVYTVNSHIDFNLVEASKANVDGNIAAGKLATRIFPFKPATIQGVKFFSATVRPKDGAAGVQTVGLTVVADPQANTPYILLNETNDKIDIAQSGWGTAAADSYTAGALTGVYTAAEIAAGNYILQTQDGVQAFYLVTSPFTATPYRAYLTAPANAGARIAFEFDGETTGISGVNAAEKKFNGAVYDLSGRKVAQPTRGMYIVNGKKVVIK